MPLSFLADLYQRRGGIKLGIGRVAAAFPFVKERSIPAYHVAGTNGKGTTVYAIDYLLRTSDLKTGCFISPHIRRFNERILVNGQSIPDEIAEKTYREIEQTIPHFSELSFFEITFLIAWRWWEKESVDRVVVEVGLGGRLDATNVIDWPKIAVITSIGFDHTHILGKHLEEIAREKLGIVHPGDTLILGPTIDSPLREWMYSTATTHGAHRIIVSPDQPPELFIPPTRMVLSREQKANLAIAYTAVKEGERSAISPNFEALVVPGRFQYLGERIILDVAHNPPAMRSLSAHLADCHITPIVLFGAMKDKDITNVLDALAPVSHSIIPIHLKGDGDRGASVEEIVRRAPETIRNRLMCFANDEEAIDCAVSSLIENPSLKLLVTGSFFTVSRFLDFLETPRGRHLAADLHLPPVSLE